MSNANNPPQLGLAELVFVAFNSRVAALNRQTGDIAWNWKSPKGSGFVAILLDGDRLMASVNGYTYCLDAQTGEQQWMNPLTGYGVGVPCLTSVRGTSLGSSVLAQSQASQNSNPTGAGAS